MFKRIFVLLLLSLSLYGCGAFVRTAYNHSDTAVRFMASDYFDVAGPQTVLVDGGVERFHAWHRREELPRYAVLFEEAAGRINRGLQRDDVQWALENMRARYRILADRAIDDALPALLTLNGDNLAALEAKFSEKNEEFSDEFLSGDATDRERAQIKAYEKRLSDWVGDLQPAQERLIAEFVRAHPRTAAIKFEDRKRRQQEMLALFKQGGDREQLRARLRDFFDNYERNRPVETAAYARRMENDFVDLLLAVDRSIDSTQRIHAAQRFERYAQDFRVLAREGRAPKNDDLAAK